MKRKETKKGQRKGILDVRHPSLCLLVPRTPKTVVKTIKNSAKSRSFATETVDNSKGLSTIWRKPVDQF